VKPTILGMLVLVAALSALSQDEYPQKPTQPPPKIQGRLRPGDYDEQVKLKVKRGLAWLAKEQQDDGSWTCKIGYKLNHSYYGEDGKHPGVTAIAAMAFLAAGNFPDRGDYAHVVNKALDFILKSSRNEDGYISANGTRMYEHGFCVLFLAHIYGQTPRADVKDKLKRAVTLLVQAQNVEGGWRYQPQPVDADLSVTVTILQALRSARAAGIAVPIETIDRATKYVRSCANAWGGGFTYQMDKVYAHNDMRSTYPLTAAGIVSLFSAGVYDSQEIRQGMNYLSTQYDELKWGKYHYFYGHYYACQAMYVHGRHWNEYYARLKNEILSNQDSDGGWTDDVGRTYATGMACLILQIPAEWFPIFQK
jgi:hypothetical protein